MKNLIGFLVGSEVSNTSGAKQRPYGPLAEGHTPNLIIYFGDGFCVKTVQNQCSIILYCLEGKSSEFCLG
jgi:hypothetical protein